MLVSPFWGTPPPMTKRVLSPTFPPWLIGLSTSFAKLVPQYIEHNFSHLPVSQHTVKLSLAPVQDPAQLGKLRLGLLSVYWLKYSLRQAQLSQACPELGTSQSQLVSPISSNTSVFEIIINQRNYQSQTNPNFFQNFRDHYNPKKTHFAWTLRLSTGSRSTQLSGEGIRSGTNPYYERTRPQATPTWTRAAQLDENGIVIRLFEPFSNF